MRVGLYGFEFQVTSILRLKTFFNLYFYFVSYGYFGDDGHICNFLQFLHIKAILVIRSTLELSRSF
jgi:hypothetical protein